MKALKLFVLGLFCCSAAFAQSVPTNRYAMKLEQKADGTYALLKEKNYAKIIDLSGVPDLLVPYVYEKDRLTGKLIPKERLKAVPHATLSVESKMMGKK